MTDIERGRRFGNFCVKCGALDVEVARPTCTNPTWHADPPPEPEPRKG